MYSLAPELLGCVGAVYGTSTSASTASSSAGVGVGVGVFFFASGVDVLAGKGDELATEIGVDEGAARSALGSDTGARAITASSPANAIPAANKTPPAIRSPGVTLLKKLAFGRGW